MSSSTHANYKTRKVSVLDEYFIQGIEGATIYAAKMYSTNFTVDNKKFCLSLHYKGDDSYLLVNGKEIYKFKAKDSKIAPYPLCLVKSISKDFSPLNMRKTRLDGYVYDFSVDY